jgi:hypothetical protein
LCAVVLPPVTHADIYKCTDEHGNVAYLQLPCSTDSEEPTDASDNAEAESAEQEPPGDEVAFSTVPEIAPSQVLSSRRPGELIDDCKKRYRDEIDLIDAEMRRGFSTQQGNDYKISLLALTAQLRACDVQSTDAQ